MLLALSLPHTESGDKVESGDAVLTTSFLLLVVTSASLVVTSACLTSSNKKLLELN